jgi:hypothetical protein
MDPTTSDQLLPGSKEAGIKLLIETINPFCDDRLLLSITEFRFESKLGCGISFLQIKSKVRRGEEREE